MKKKNIKYILLGTAILSCFIMTRFIAFPTVYGHSMEPNYYAGDVLYMDKTAYKSGDINRFDVVVAKADGLLIIKRIIGLPGEKIYIDKEGNIYINDEILKEKYGREIIKDAGIAGKEYEIPEDSVFLMGDNRNASDDSRVFGAVKTNDILGRCNKYLFNIKGTK